MVVKHAFEYKGDLTYDGKPIEEQHTVNRKCSLKEPCSIQFLILKSKTKQVSLVEVDNSLTRLSERSERNIVNMFDLTTEKLMAVIDNLPFNELLRIGEKVCRDNPEWKSIFPQESIFDQIENINPACTDNPLSSYLDQKAGESTIGITTHTAGYPTRANSIRANGMNSKNGLTKDLKVTTEIKQDRIYLELYG